jgi:hypothetical protein
VSCGIGRLPNAIPEALLVITQSTIRRDVAVHFNMEKHKPFYSARRDEELKWERRENKNRYTAYCCVTDVSFGNITLDSRLGIDQKEPGDHLIPS